MYCRSSQQGWNAFLDLLGWLPKLDTVQIWRCMVGSSGYGCSRHRGFDLNFEWEGQAGVFASVCRDLDDLEGWEGQD